MMLEDVDGLAFGLMVAWLYTQEIKDEDLANESQATGKELAKSSRQLRLAKLWVLSQRFLVPELQNAVIKKLHPPLLMYSTAENFWTEIEELVKYVYSGEYDELRKLVAKFLAFSGKESVLKECAGKLCQQALIDVTKLLNTFFCQDATSSYRSRLADPSAFFVGDAAKPSMPGTPAESFGRGGPPSRRGRGGRIFG